MTDEGSKGLLHLLGAVLDALHGCGEQPGMGVRAVISLHRATLTRVEVGNIFGDHNAFPSMNADCPWFEVSVIVAHGLEAFDDVLHRTAVFGSMVGAVGE